MVGRDKGSAASSETLTFVFTDLESSTRLREKFPDAMKDASDGQLLESLKLDLRGRHLLLLLDNFEQVMDAADGVADPPRELPTAQGSRDQPGSGRQSRRAQISATAIELAAAR